MEFVIFNYFYFRRELMGAFLAITRAGKRIKKRTMDARGKCNSVISAEKC